MNAEANALPQIEQTLRLLHIRKYWGLIMDEKLIENFLEMRNIFAVVGASRDHKKYGHQVYRDLRNSGYNVYPVNQKADEILGDK